MTTTTKNTLANEITNLLKGRVRVHEALTLAEVYAAVAGLATVAEFKKVMVELYEAGRIQLEDYTRAWADIINEECVIEYRIDWARGYGLKWFARGIN